MASLADRTVVNRSAVRRSVTRDAALGQRTTPRLVSLSRSFLVDETALVSDGANEHSHPGSDWSGIILSVACGIHCLATPLLATFLPMAGLSNAGLAWADQPWIHQAFFVGCLIVAAVAVQSGYRVHGKRLVPGVALGGLTLLAVSAFVWPTSCCVEVASLPAWDTVLQLLTPVGGAMLILAHAMNIRHLRERPCGCRPCSV